MPRRKQTADEHKQSGTYRADRHEAKPATVGLLKKLPPSPFPLSPGAQEIYNQEGQKLIDAEMLKITDLHTLAQYASEADVYSRCMEALNAGEMVVELHNKVTAPNHYRKMAETALKNLFSLSDRLGLSPRSRHAMKGEAAFADEKAKSDSPVMQLLNRKKPGVLAFLNEPN